MRADAFFLGNSVVQYSGVLRSDGRGEQSAPRAAVNGRMNGVMTGKNHRRVTAAEAAAQVQSGDRVITGQAAGLPAVLLEALSRRQDLQNVEVFHVLSMAEAPYCAPEAEGRFCFNTIFASASTRKAVQEGRADFTASFFYRLPALVRERPFDVAMVQVSPPDRHGWCSLGVAVDYALEAVHTAGLVIAQVNENMPRTLGDCFIHVDEIDFLVEENTPLPELPPAKIGPVEQAIGRYCASLIRDGDTLQLGIGAIPDAVLLFLGDKKDLGIHSEMISDGVVELIEKGVVTCRRKTLDPGKCVVAFLIGSRRLYDFVDDNPFVEMRTVDYVNDPSVIARQDNMVSINSCLQVDLLGQVCSEAVGNRQFSGVGGQVDFIRGAAMSRGGRAIIAMPSTAAKGTLSRIVAQHGAGAVITTSRNDVDAVVTEYGIAQLRGKTVRERAQSLIAIAHPDFREELREQYCALFHQVI